MQHQSIPKYHPRFGERARTGPVCRTLAVCALASVIFTDGCLIDPASHSPESPEIAGVWHETGFERALVLEPGGRAVCAGTLCSRVIDTLGTGTWESDGAILTLAGVSGSLWWPGGTGLRADSIATFEFDLSDENMTLRPALGNAVTYARSVNGDPEACSIDTNLVLLFPRGGEAFAQGEKIRIRWRTSAQISSVIAEFSSDDGRSFWNICGRSIVPVDSTSFEWIVEPFDNPADQCLVQIFDYSNHDLGFSISGVFSVTSLP